MNLVVALAILLVGWLAIRLVDAVVRRALMRGKAKQTLFVNFVCSVVSKACWAVLLIMVAGRLGVNVAPLIAGLGVTGFILGFAFQETLGNFASGMMIAINEPFKVGDFVDAAGHSGTILEVTMMATVMKTPDNKRIVIPNKSVSSPPCRACFRTLRPWSRSRHSTTARFRSTSVRGLRAATTGPSPRRRLSPSRPSSRRPA